MTILFIIAIFFILIYTCLILGQGYGERQERRRIERIILKYKNKINDGEIYKINDKCGICGNKIDTKLHIGGH